MGNDRMTEDDLDSLFAAARDDRPAPPAALTARVLADAADWAGPVAVVPAAPTPAAPTPAAPHRPSPLAALVRLFGGSGALAGMATATVAGFWIGFAQPMEAGLVSAMLGAESAEIDLMPGLDALLNEVP